MIQPRVVTFGIIVCLWGCGKPTLPDHPQLHLDRDSIGFGQEFGSATFIGTRPQESLLLENGGLEPLVISSVTLTGDSAFTLDGPTSNEVKGKDHTFLRVIFAPTQSKTYSGTLNILSNAENAPQKTVAVTGAGVKQPTDAGP